MKPNFRLKHAYEQDNPATRDQGTDRPGRTNDNLGWRSATILELDKDRTKHPVERIEKIVVKALDEAIRRSLGQ